MRLYDCSWCEMLTQGVVLGVEQLRWLEVVGTEVVVEAYVLVVLEVG